ncbi:HTH_Tnp_Tc3_2 domain-containing protein [Trichonephila clavipes]|nr:HTH_Tnp_Tc3_2 domain-containing protein [Trichonephila clavipes]
MMRNKMQNREKLSVVGDKCRDWHAWEEEEALCKTAQITTQLKDGASRTVSKRTEQCSLHRMGFESRGPTIVPLLNARHRAAHLPWARDHRDWSMKDWKRVARRNESCFRLLNANGRLRIWHQAHESLDST